MTKAGEALPVAILVPGNFNDHAIGRIDKAFRRVRIERADPALVTDEMRKTVRGIASFGGIDAAMIDALPNLEIIANFGVGYDSVDARHAATRGVMVTNTPDVLTEEVADTTIGLLINTVRELYAAEKYLRDGDWVKHGNYRLSRLTLRGRHVGIFGMGRIGLAVARRVEAFGLPIAYHNRRKVEGLTYEYHATLKGLAEAVDTLICIAPGGAATEKAISAEVLSALGSNGVLVNIGRGSTVDEAALAFALKNGTIAAAGLDVFADEPNVPEALLEASNTSLLPHVGSASQHTRRAMADLCVDNLVTWFTERRPLTPVPETVNVKART
ncbi:2-hydroxyacid dehydrogenase [Mesorhizobium sp. M2D.F.Ca.ET.185.01.1.1]|uniref:2-hydroxyacid dehydrogenase n=1 Tax=unclassified Mesorhizobium TaxID=325217 RepID=UPI000FCAE7B6|nr:MULTISPECIES: 2-hydroxyacid dehydrogenase [unclassified Mesorhizobium]TGP82229.1 2-hydroxyacid dehydrogenase [bacterium M00.F.Ca.ET.227.01.1.1]TGP91887.1 2-hydroxyacid dehydrogenase [bacterium M00.F.Ca.ET.221.01.1.1]TGP95327.1 2-hydroxyacid dehydrogenase [bacterium M00.F.Ca.ET.222.01.1.1]TGU03677.1 2-hydroxyacid dehydrogenase [bacterium M00.F.Ca.ET.163.01.1.1]TGU38743.1 2-hydroxyacid dehydrogenase [bacterium M00.F.Ca.ET.156.01.1.1]TGU47911.1 2-hydroxyacid dehydrogenase [bacterium M00.F.Ca.